MPRRKAGTGTAKKTAAPAAPPLPVQKPKRAAPRPYRTPNELFRAMQEYFEACKRETDWQGIVTAMAEIAAKAEAQGSWDGLDKEYSALVEAIMAGDCFPDEAGMRIHLKLAHDSYQEYKEDPEFAKIFDWAQDTRESWAARKLAREPRQAQAFLNILKQSANGGWVDRKTDSGNKTLGLKLVGVGGPEAFIG